MLFIKLGSQVRNGIGSFYGFGQGILGLLRSQSIRRKHGIGIPQESIQSRICSIHVVGPQVFHLEIVIYHPGSIPSHARHLEA